MSADGTMADESKLDILGVIEGLKPGETGQLVIDDLQLVLMHLYVIHLVIIPKKWFIKS